jgi:hypothetical protein
MLLKSVVACQAQMRQRVAPVTAFVTVNFSFDDELEHMHLNHLWKRLVKEPQEEWWPSYNAEER